MDEKVSMIMYKNRFLIMYQKFNSFNPVSSGNWLGTTKLYDERWTGKQSLLLWYLKVNYIYILFSPKPTEEKVEETEEPWSTQAPEILHLTDSTFDEGLKEHASILVMFYAPCM